MTPDRLLFLGMASPEARLPSRPEEEEVSSESGGCHGVNTGSRKQRPRYEAGDGTGAGARRSARDRDGTSLLSRQRGTGHVTSRNSLGPGGVSLLVSKKCQKAH